jgi:hypothetical protein
MYLRLSHDRDRQIRADFFTTIQDLINTYLSQTYLNDRLQELPQQFNHPQPRKWARIDWQSIDCDAIVGIESKLFLAIIKGAIDTEAPIRDYTHTSRQYLDPIHPLMAKFVGGTVDQIGNLQLSDRAATPMKGIWELEERRHAPALIAIYQRLSGEKIKPNAKTARLYQPTNSPDDDLYRHGLHRISTEYGATCLYLWLMGHSTGILRQILGEMVEDEINHLIKFWGFGIWLYPDPKGSRFIHGCRQLLPRQSSGSNLLKTYHRMMSVLHWQDWTLQHRWQLVSTFYLVMKRLLVWHHSLTSANLEQIFGTSPNRSTHNK